MLKIEFLGMNLNAIENQDNLAYFSIETEKGKVEVHEFLSDENTTEKKDSHIKANEADKLKAIFDTQNSSQRDAISRIEDVLNIDSFHELLDKAIVQKLILEYKKLADESLENIKNNTSLYADDYDFSVFDEHTNTVMRDIFWQRDYNWDTLGYEELCDLRSNYELEARCFVDEFSLQKKLNVL